MNIEKLTPLATVKSIEPFEAIVVCHYKIVMNNVDTRCSQAITSEYIIKLPKGIKLVVGARFYDFTEMIHLTVPDYNYKDVIVDYLKLKNADIIDLEGVSLDVNRSDLELKFEIIELFNYDKPNLKYGSERLVVVERLMEHKEYKPDIPFEILNKRDEILKEMEEEDLKNPHYTRNEWVNQLIYFMEDYLDKNKLKS